jgi:small subunit ribosomal protein S3
MGEPGSVEPPVAEPSQAEVAEPAEEEAEDLIKPADPDFERLIAEEEEIDRRTREHHDLPHFKKDDG